MGITFWRSIEPLSARQASSSVNDAGRISCLYSTIFLNPPESYDGGELVIRTRFGEQQVRLPAGHAVVYLSASVHRVAEVTCGECLVTLTRIQSFVRDAARREPLYELDLAREQPLKSDPESDVSKHVDRSFVNPLRLWAEV